LLIVDQPILQQALDLKLGEGTKRRSPRITAHTRKGWLFGWPSSVFTRFSGWPRSAQVACMVHGRFCGVTEFVVAEFRVTGRMESQATLRTLVWFTGILLITEKNGRLLVKADNP